MSIGAAILIVGILSLFVLGPSWFRKLVLVLGAIAIIGGGAFFFVIVDPQAVAPVGCKTSLGRSFLPEAVCQQLDASTSKSFDPDAFIASANRDAIYATVCKAARSEQACADLLKTAGKNPFDAFGVPTCTTEQVAKVHDAEKGEPWAHDPLVSGQVLTPASDPELSAACLTPSAQRIMPTCTAEQMKEIETDTEPKIPAGYHLGSGQIETAANGAACLTP